MSSLLWVLLLYSLSMLLVGLTAYRKNATLDEINLSSGNANWIATAFSTAATWIWAPALFVASQRAYVDGILGFMWFFVPNVLALVWFGLIASRAVKGRWNGEHTLANMMGNIFHSKRIKNIYTFELVFLSVCSTGVQLLAGGKVLQMLTGLDFGLVTILMALVALTYSLLGGLRASVRTDFWQMIIMLVAVAIAIYHTGIENLQFGGFNNLPTGFFSEWNWKLFISFGLTTSIGLTSGPIADQTFWQRAYSMRKSIIKKSFILSAFIFALIPMGTSIIGFSAASAGFIPNDVSMVGIEYLASFAPTYVISLFVVCIISGLSSTLDSNMCAMGSIVSTFSDRFNSPWWSRLGMVAMGVFGIIIANVPGLDIFWLFLFYGVMRSSIMIPTMWTLISKNLPSERDVYYGIFYAFLIAVPIYSIGAIIKNVNLTFIGTILTVIIPTLFLLKGKYYDKKA